MKPVQIPSFMSIGTTGNEESLMHGLAHCSSKRVNYFVHKSGPVSYGLISSYLGYILMYGWSQSISAL